jgi:hypothetical protein
MPILSIGDGWRLAFVAVNACSLTVAEATAQPVRFRNEVMAVLSRAGCNQGACHGNQNGKNGFKLSLRGEDPDYDLRALARDMLGRRVNLNRPDESLLLLKATATVPHEGGRRFGPSSPEYDILRRWIAAGSKPDPADTPVLQRLEVTPTGLVIPDPADRVSLQVRALFSDGSVQEVTRLAVFDSSNPVVSVSPDGVASHSQDSHRGVAETAILVRYLDRQATVPLAFLPARPGFTWSDVPEANFIDHHVFAKLRSLQIQPSNLCSDTDFLRRAFLDLLGVLPSTAEVREFLADSRPDKRARLVDGLLERPEFADFWALKWADLLRNEEKTLDRKGVETFHHWIRQSLAEGKPLNEFARELIASRGSTYARPAANFYRALRDPSSRAEAAAQVFLGVRLQCARCHNHPFDRWTQDDYYGLSAFFARVQYHIVENNRKDRLDTHEFDGEQIVWPAREGEIRHPRTGEVLRPRFLGEPTPEAVAAGDRLQILADWVANPTNPYFARVQANRVWFHLLGRGIVEPIDDFRITNPPSNVPLLEALAHDFTTHGFDLRHLVRTIVNSRTYQIAAAPNETNREDESNFSHALVRPLQAEPLLDALVQVLDVPVKYGGYPSGTRSAQLPGVRPSRERDRRSSEGETFLRRFGKPERLLSCECERADDTTLGKAFQLMTGQMLNRMLSEPDNRIGRVLAAGKSNQEIIEEFYLAALSRPPSRQDVQAAMTYVERAADRRAALEDVVWGLVNAKEFLLRH